MDSNLFKDSITKLISPHSVGGFFLTMFPIFLILFHYSSALSCADYKALQMKKIAYADLKTMPEEDVVRCMPLFGQDPNIADESEGTFIWETLVKVRGGASEVTDMDLRQLGWLLRSVPETDMANFTLNEPDTIAALGHFRNLSEIQGLAEQVQEDWANKDATQYTNYDLSALQHILCGFNRSSIEAIHSDSYKDAAASLSSLQGCTMEAFEALAGLAQAHGGFGSPDSWSASQLRYIGCVMNGLTAEAMALIPTVGFEEITPDIVPCIYPETFTKMSAVQLTHLTPSAVSAMTPQQRVQLTIDQGKAVAAVYASATAKSSGSLNAPTCLLALFLFIKFCFNRFLP